MTNTTPSTAAKYRRLRKLRDRVRNRAERELAPDQVVFLVEILDLDGHDDTKKCTGPCGEDKPLTAFGRDRGYLRGLCKECDAASKRKPGNPPRKDRPVPECGTPAAARRHYRKGEKLDPRCADVLARKWREQKRDARRTQRSI